MIGIEDIRRVTAICDICLDRDISLVDSTVVEPKLPYRWETVKLSGKKIVICASCCQNILNGHGVGR